MILKNIIFYIYKNIKKGLGLPWLATIFAVFGALASFGIGNMTQANSVADALRSTFNISPVITGVVLAVLTGIVILGGIKRIGAVTEKLVPFMALFYIITTKGQGDCTQASSKYCKPL